VNLLAHPDFTFHLKASIQADLPAVPAYRGNSAAGGIDRDLAAAGAHRSGCGRMGRGESAGGVGVPIDLMPATTNWETTEWAHATLLATSNLMQQTI